MNLRARPLAALSVLCLCAFATHPFCAAQDWPQDIELALEITGEFSPFASVKYEIRQSQAGATLVLERAYHGSFRQDTGLSLLSDTQLASIRSKLGQCGSLATFTKEAQEKTDQQIELKNKEEAIYRLQWRTHGAVSERILRGDVIRFDAISWCTVRVLQNATKELLDEIPFEMVFIAHEEMGYVDIVTRPPAKVWIDGFPVEGMSPVWKHPVVSGVKRVLIREDSLGIKQEFELRVDPGGTTALELDLLR